MTRASRDLRDDVTNATRHLHNDETGSTLILTIFFAMLSLVLVLLVTAASSLYLERKRLFTLADGAALAGAEAFELTDLATLAGGTRPQLKDPDVAAAVQRHVELVPHSFEGLAIDRAATPDGAGVVVELSSTWRPPVVTLFVPDGIRVSVEASARSVVG